MLLFLQTIAIIIIVVTIGPVVGGGLIMTSQTWRATFWFLFAYGAVILVFVFFALPETYRDIERFDNNITEKMDIDDKDKNKDQEREQKSQEEEIIMEEEKRNIAEDDLCSSSVDPGTTVINMEDQEEENGMEETNTKSKTELIKSGEKKRINPIEPFLMLRHPFVFLASMISGISFGAMYAIGKFNDGSFFLLLAFFALFFFIATYYNLTRSLLFFSYI